MPLKNCGMLHVFPCDVVLVFVSWDVTAAVRTGHVAVGRKGEVDRRDFSHS
jgi:hypothetical protein